MRYIRIRHYEVCTAKLHPKRHIVHYHTQQKIPTLSGWDFSYDSGNYYASKAKRL